MTVLCASGTRSTRTVAERRPTRQMEIQASNLAKYEPVSTLGLKAVDFPLSRPQPDLFYCPYMAVIKKVIELRCSIIDEQKK